VAVDPGTMPVSLPLARRANAALSSVAVAYLIAGLVHGLLTTVAFCWAHAEYYRLSIALTAFIVLSLPAVATALYVWAEARWRVALLLAILVVVFAVLPGRELAWAIFEGQLLLPTALLLLFSLRFWRGIAPLLLLVTWPIFVLWSVGFGLAKELTDYSIRDIWIGRTIGIAIGAACGYGVLRLFSR
jgi:hypothetical protein